MNFGNWGDGMNFGMDLSGLANMDFSGLNSLNFGGNFGGSTGLEGLYGAAPIATIPQTLAAPAPVSTPTSTKNSWTYGRRANGTPVWTHTSGETVDASDPSFNPNAIPNFGGLDNASTAAATQARVAQADAANAAAKAADEAKWASDQAAAKTASDAAARASIATVGLGDQEKAAVSNMAGTKDTKKLISENNLFAKTEDGKFVKFGTPEFQETIAKQMDAKFGSENWKSGNNEGAIVAGKTIPLYSSYVDSLGLGYGKDTPWTGGEGMVETASVMSNPDKFTQGERNRWISGYKSSGGTEADPVTYDLGNNLVLAPNDTTQWQSMSDKHGGGLSKIISQLGTVASVAGLLTGNPWLGAIGKGASLGNAAGKLATGQDLSLMEILSAAGNIYGMMGTGSDPAALKQAGNDFGWSDAASPGTTAGANADIFGAAGVPNIPDVFPVDMTGPTKLDTGSNVANLTPNQSGALTTQVVPKDVADIFDRAGTVGYDNYGNPIFSSNPQSFDSLLPKAGDVFDPRFGPVQAPDLSVGQQVGQATGTLDAAGNLLQQGLPGINQIYDFAKGTLVPAISTAAGGLSIANSLGNSGLAGSAGTGIFDQMQKLWDDNKDSLGDIGKLGGSVKDIFAGAAGAYGLKDYAKSQEDLAKYMVENADPYRKFRQEQEIPFLSQLMEQQQSQAGKASGLLADAQKYSQQTPEQQALREEVLSKYRDTSKADSMLTGFNKYSGESDQTRSMLDQGIGMMGDAQKYLMDQTRSNEIYGNVNKYGSLNPDAQRMLGRAEQLMGQDVDRGQYDYYANRLKGTYEDPLSVYQSPEMRAIQDIQRQEMERKDAAVGRNSQYGARQVEMQNNWLKDLGNYRTGLSGTMGQVGNYLNAYQQGNTQAGSALGGMASNLQSQQNDLGKMYASLYGTEQSGRQGIGSTLMQGGTSMGQLGNQYQQNYNNIASNYANMYGQTSTAQNQQAGGMANVLGDQLNYQKSLGDLYGNLYSTTQQSANALANAAKPGGDPSAGLSDYSKIMSGANAANSFWTTPLFGSTGTTKTA